MRCLRSLELSRRAHFSQVTLAIILHLYSQPISRLSHSNHLKQKQERTFLEKNTPFGRVTLALLHNTLVCEKLPFPSFSPNCTFTVVLPPPPLPCCVSFLGVLGSCVPVCRFSVVCLLLNCLASLTTMPLVVLSLFFLFPICLLSLHLVVLYLSPVVPLGCLSVSLMSFDLKLV